VLVDRQGVQSHRAVNEHRHRRDASLVHQPAKLEDHELRPVHGERRNEDDTAPRDGSPDRVGENLRIVFGMTPVAVRRLEDQGVDRRRWWWRQQQRVTGPAQVAAERHPVAAQIEDRHRGTEDVAGRLQRECDRPTHRDLRAVRDGMEQGHGLLDVRAAVQR